MNIAAIKNKTRYGSFFIPFRLIFVLLLVALVLAGRWLQKTNALPDTSYAAILSVFLHVTFWFVVSLFLVSFLTAIIPWLLFLWNRKNKRVVVSVKTNATQHTYKDKQEVAISIHPILKPLFGYIRLRLQYDEDAISDKFSLYTRHLKQQLFPVSVKGFFSWPLNEIREYKVTESIVYFEDMFQFFSFAATVPVQENFFTQPEDVAAAPLKVKPKKTEDMTTRIEEIRKVEGEFLNYKNFENNDDVRRIVWKIYAKNKELVVRIPETNDPYASHVYFYASFFNTTNAELDRTFNSVFLNYYKTCVWSIYRQISTQQVLIKYIPDQEVKVTFEEDPARRIKHLVSTSEWQSNKDLRSYFRKDEASVICISSLVPAEQVADMLETAGESLVVVFINVSNAFNTIKVKDWVEWIFIRPAKDSLDRSRLLWNFSPARNSITNNEKAIRKLLERAGCEKVIL